MGRYTWYNDDVKNQILRKQSSHQMRIEYDEMKNKSVFRGAI